ncbi:MAG: NAD(P)-binding domain-containing protein, partial [Candidatus Lokiarchaeota archaeon]|nr:NAD(P)-binding domain-containing protein [Candidatus Lokiarchaeota archaeon]
MDRGHRKVREGRPPQADVKVERMKIETIGWIGTGVMGKSMCSHVMNKGGFEALVYNRTRGKADDLVKLGATWCPSPKDVAEKSDVVFTIVGFPKDVEDVYFGEHGVLKGVKKGSIVVDMTTTEPSLAIRIHGAASKLGVAALDAPVSGGDVGARNGTLAIMAGGDKGAFDETLPLFQMMGDKEKIAYMGPAGAGQHTK